MGSVPLPFGFAVEALPSPDLEAGLFWEIVLLTLRVTGLALLISSALGIPVGALLGLVRFRGRGFLTALIFTGMGLPPVLVGLVVYLVLSHSGPLGFLGWLFTPSAMALAQVVIAFPLVAGLTMAALQGVDPALSLQVRSLGADRVQEVLTLLNEAKAGVVAAVLAGFGGIISEVGAAMLVGGNIESRTRVLSTAIVLETRRGDFALALALGGVLLALAFSVNVVLLRMQVGVRWGGR